MANQATWISIDRAPLYPKWEIVEWAFHDGDDCDNESVNCYFAAFVGGKGVSGKKVLFATPDESAPLTLQHGQVGYCYDAQGKEIKYGVAVPMSGDSSFNPAKGQSGPYSAYMEGNSDKIRGMGLPLKQHVQYTVVWEWRTDGDVPPVPVPTGRWVIASQTETEIVLRRVV